MSTARYLEEQVREDLTRKMVFVSGPRQVGKTTMAKQVAGQGGGYLSWDIPADRERILRRELPASRLWVFDELHKFRTWRAYLKGLWDARAEGQQVLVTGSARLDLFSRGGESLQGRYHHLRLHPLSVAELGLDREGLLDLLKLGGFPEPWFGASERLARRWSREYRSVLVREEVADLEQIRDLGQLEELMLALPERVGSPLSINSLREDLQRAHATVAKWVDALERLYALFRIAPFGAPRLRAVRKERKHYHFDWTVVPDEGARFENLVACHLLKWVHHEQDAHGRDLELRYFRTVDGREVDFVVVERREPVLLVEAKRGDEAPDRGLRYLHERYRGAEAWQVSAHGTKDFVTPTGLRVAPAVTLLRRLA